MVREFGDSEAFSKRISPMNKREKNAGP